jgi:hypothetical protein
MDRWKRLVFAIIAGAALAGLPLPAATSAGMVDLDPVLVGGPPYRRLFLDSMVVEDSGGLERVFHAATKYEGNPVFTKEKNWEGWGPSCGGTVIRDADKLRMYYYTIEGCHGVAESKDGLHWTRPVLGLVDWKGSKENNIINCSPQVFRLAHPASSEKAWVSLSSKRASYSTDGYKWTPESRTGAFFTSSDVVNFFYDPYNDRMCATWKCASRRLRSCGVVWSSDLEKWTKPIDGPVFTADDLDPDATQVYGMPVFAYQGLYIGLPSIYHARNYKYGDFTANRMVEAQEGSPRTMDVQLAWSWDLINWTRTPKREPFIGNSPSHAFDSGLAFASRAPVVMGDELWFYYSGWDQAHEDYEGVDCSVGLAKLRIDGFCSMRAGDEEGWLISRREMFNTPKIIINARCRPNGYVAAEILDRNNNPIPGFEWYYSKAFSGDSVRGELTWKTAKFAPKWIDKDKKIRFRIKNADLYSYLPMDINQQIDDGSPEYTFPEFQAKKHKQK